MTFANSDKADGLIRSDRRGRLLVRAEQRAAILQAFDAGSLSAMAFCRQHGLSYSTFATWIQKRRRENTVPAPEVCAPAPANPSFAEVHLDQPAIFAQSHRPIKLNLPSGVSVEISDPSQIPLVIELLRHLSSSRPC
jgi:hypothetical protein